jgi:deoxyribodipyrimidine photolyase
MWRTLIYKMAVSIPKLTFRTTDNALLEGADLVLVILQSERLPAFDYARSRRHHAWSHHQFNLLLQTLVGHQRDLGIPMWVLVVKNDELETVLEIVKRRFKRAVTDYTVDPAFRPLNDALRKVYGKSLQELCTQTLVDWRNPEHQESLREYFKNAKPFSKLTPLKRHAVEAAQEPVAVRHESASADRRAPDWPEELKRWRFDLEHEMVVLRSSMAERGLTPHYFGSEQAPGLDEELRQHARTMLELVDYDGWSKPKTSLALDWNYCGSRKGSNTTKLSPFLSLGSLSVRDVWKMLKTEDWSTGTIRDQLLWRESFYATAIAAETLEGGRVRSFWAKSGGEFVDPKPFDWRSCPEALKRWQLGQLNEKDDGFEATDANESMCQLYLNGWIHHLRRHLVADVLTRGRLQQHWHEGEEWFRHTLLDHDAVLNRANWMWLSAVAFSSKQKVYHYKPSDYVRRLSKPVTGRVSRIESPYLLRGETVSRQLREDFAAFVRGADLAKTCRRNFY